MDMPSEERQCYSAIRHSTHGDVIHVRDCVLLRSGCCKSDVPYVAKVGAFWEHPKTSETLAGSRLPFLLPLFSSTTNGLIINDTEVHLYIIRFTLLILFLTISQAGHEAVYFWGKDISTWKSDFLDQKMVQSVNIASWWPLLSSPCSCLFLCVTRMQLWTRAVDSVFEMKFPSVENLAVSEVPTFTCREGQNIT